MSALIRFQSAYIFTKKTKRLMGLFCAIIYGVLVLQSQFYLPLNTRLLCQESLAYEYFFEMLSLYQLAVIILMIFLTFQAYLKNPCDILLVQRSSRVKVFYSKYVIGLSIITLFTLYYGTIYVTSAYVLSIPVASKMVQELLIYFILYSFLYYQLMIFMIELTHHLFSLLLVFILSSIGNILIDSLSEIGTISLYKRLYVLIFPSIHVMADFNVTLLMSPLYIIAYSLLLHLLSLGLFKIKEF